MHSWRVAYDIKCGVIITSYDINLAITNKYLEDYNQWKIGQTNLQKTVNNKKSDLYQSGRIMPIFRIFLNLNGFIWFHFISQTKY